VEHLTFTQFLLMETTYQCKDYIQPTNCVSCDSAHAHVHKAWKLLQQLELFSCCYSSSRQGMTNKWLLFFWSMWKYRNLKVWQDVTELSLQVVERAHRLMEDCLAANATTTTCHRGQSNCPTGWTQHQIAANIDQHSTSVTAGMRHCEAAVCYA